jgi:amidohydrolase
MKLLQKIKDLSEEYYDEVIYFRRHFHALPELSMQEHKTAAFIADRLKEFGISYKEGVAETGIVGLIEGRNPDSALVVLRADMDALPIHEENRVEYKSTVPGVMHACGHDVHMASLLGTAKILHSLRDEWDGSVKLIFQPSEERYPGGASMMIEEGVLDNPRPVAILGQHVFPGLAVGKIGVRSGRYMASTDEVYIHVKGKGGHAATPNLNVDPVVIASHIVIALQQIVSRNATPHIPTVLSFGRIIGEGQMNVIPDEVRLEGTFRTFDEAWRQKAHQRIREIAVFIAQGMGGDCDVFIEPGYPFLENDPGLTGDFKKWASEYVGPENIEELELSMTAEDFAHYAQKATACFYRLGISNLKSGITAKLHTSTFDIDEMALKTGMGLMAWAAVRKLSDNQKT